MNSSQKIPGYSGHIPQKLDIVGHTTGESNRQAGNNFRYTVGARKGMADTGASIFNQAKLTQQMRSTSVDGTNEMPQKVAMRGNMSKTSCTWMNGPTHEIRNQCVPGYTGFVSGINSENLFGKSYSHNTAKSFKGKIPRGINHAPNKRFVSQNQKVYKETNSRRIAENPDFASRRDYLEYMMTINNDNTQKSKNAAYLSKTGTFDKFRGDYHDQTYTTMSPKKHTRDLKGSPLQYYQDQVQLKPKLLESGLANKKEFQDLPVTFKQLIADDPADQAMRLPIVGYCGHRKGEKSENMFAKNYRETTLMATKNLRATKALPSAAK